MPDRTDHPLDPPPAQWALLAVACVAALAGAAAGHTLGGALPAQRSDLALRLAALAALPLPALVLFAVTTPRHGELRRWMGESAASQVASGAAASWRWLLAALGAPLGLAAQGWATGAEFAPSLWALVLAQTGAWAGSVTAVVYALRAMGAAAQGGSPLRQALAGGGAFGPAATAPLLYAPALGWVAGLVPVVVLTAMWGARPEQLVLPPPWMALALPWVARWQVARALAATRLQLHAGLLAAAEAHAAPFAQAELLPPTPRWMAALTDGLAAARWMTLAWSRHHPMSPWVTLAAIAGAAAVVSGPAGAAVTAAAIALLSLLRAAAIDDLAATAAAHWLGATPADQRAARQRLAATVGAPAVVALALGWPGDAAWAAAAGLGAGTLVAELLLLFSPAPTRRWLSSAGWAAYGVALGVATVGP